MYRTRFSSRSKLATRATCVATLVTFGERYLRKTPPTEYLRIRGQGPYAVVEVECGDDLDPDFEELVQPFAGEHGSESE